MFSTNGRKLTNTGLLTRAKIAKITSTIAVIPTGNICRLFDHALTTIPGSLNWTSACVIWRTHQVSTANTSITRLSVTGKCA